MTIGFSSGRWRALALALGLSLSFGTHGAAAADATSEASWGLGSLMQRLAQVKSSKAKFVERKHLRMLNAPLEFSGTLVYTAPGHLEKHTLLPKPETLILKGDTLSVEDKVRNRRRTLSLQDYPVVWAFVESIRATLAGDLQSLNRFYQVSLEGTEQQWVLVLKPRDAGMQRFVDRIRVSGQMSSVRTIEVIEAEGDRSVMTITEDAQ